MNIRSIHSYPPQKAVAHLFFISLFFISLVGCGIPKPLRPDDRYVTLNLQRKFVRENAERKPFWEQSGAIKDWKAESVEKRDDRTWSSFDIGSEGVFLILGIVMVASGIESLKYLEGTDVYVCPEGYKGYKQKVTWGKNRVYYPGSLKKKYIRFIVEIEGNYRGEGTIDIYSRQEKPE